ncbi:MAG TPA: hypothetical protein VIV06_00275 [Candidatus Limnocylindrales bacterium]
MHRRPIGRGRWLAAISAVVILVACVLPWYTAGGEGAGIPARSVDAFQGAGILTFVTALATLALVALPYAAGDRPVGVDRGLSYALLLLLGAVGVGLRVVDVVTGGLLIGGLRPDRAPGIWLASAGLIVLARAAFEIAQAGERQ